MFNGFLGLGRLGRARAIVAALAIGLATTFVVATTADARLGGGGSFGSRGSRTYSMPSATPTAPRAAPFQRSTTPNGGFTNLGRTSSGFFGSGFGSGFGRGLVGGFLGAGLFGLLFGNGLTGGLGGGLSIIGLLLQLGLLYLGFRLVMGFFANRRQALNAGPYGGGQATYGTGAASGGFRYPGDQRQAVQARPIEIAPEDYQAFEHRLVESQAAYSNGDVGTLRRVSTPEMAGNFEQELRENDRQGVVNKISDVHLVKGDLSEAWQENGSDYATVAMRFSLIDATTDKSTGRVVAGNPQTPQEVTEVWTFRRPAGTGPQGWALSAIQQA